MTIYKRFSLIAITMVFVLCIGFTLISNAADEENIDETIIETQESSEVTYEKVPSPFLSGVDLSNLDKLPDTSELEEPVTEETTEEVEESIEEHTEPKPEHLYYDVPLSTELQDWVRFCLNYVGCNLDESYIYALIYQESRFTPTAVGASNDSGYCQIIPSTFKIVYSEVEKKYPELRLVDDVFNEKTNIFCAVYYLNSCAKQISGEVVSTNNISLSLTAYNRGANGARELFNSTGSYRSTYSESILRIAKLIQENRGLTDELKSS